MKPRSFLIATAAFLPGALLVAALTGTSSRGQAPAPGAGGPFATAVGGGDRNPAVVTDARTGHTWVRHLFAAGQWHDLWGRRSDRSRADLAGHHLRVRVGVALLSRRLGCPLGRRSWVR